MIYTREKQQLGAPLSLRRGVGGEADQQFHKLFDLLQDSCSSSTPLTGFNPAAETIIREVAATQTKVSEHAKTVLRIAFGDEFEYEADTVPAGIPKRGEDMLNESVLQDVPGIYPNPAGNRVIVNIALDDGDAEFNVYDLVGERIISVLLADGSNSIEFDRRFSPGVYLFRIERERRLIDAGKIVIIR